MKPLGTIYMKPRRISGLLVTRERRPGGPVRYTFCVNGSCFSGLLKATMRAIRNERTRTRARRFAGAE